MADQDWAADLVTEADLASEGPVGIGLSNHIPKTEEQLRFITEKPEINVHPEVTSSSNMPSPADFSSKPKTHRHHYLTIPEHNKQRIERAKKAAQDAAGFVKPGATRRRYVTDNAQAHLDFLENPAIWDVDEGGAIFQKGSAAHLLERKFERERGCVEKLKLSKHAACALLDLQHEIVKIAVDMEMVFSTWAEMNHDTRKRVLDDPRSSPRPRKQSQSDVKSGTAGTHTQRPELRGGGGKSFPFRSVKPCHSRSKNSDDDTHGNQLSSFLQTRDQAGLEHGLTQTGLGDNPSEEPIGAEEPTRDASASSTSALLREPGSPLLRCTLPCKYIRDLFVFERLNTFSGSKPRIRVQCGSALLNRQRDLIRSLEQLDDILSFDWEGKPSQDPKYSGVDMYLPSTQTSILVASFQQLSEELLPGTIDQSPFFSNLSTTVRDCLDFSKFNSQLKKRIATALIADLMTYYQSVVQDKEFIVERYPLFILIRISRSTLADPDSSLVWTSFVDFCEEMLASARRAATCLARNFREQTSAGYTQEDLEANFGAFLQKCLLIALVPAEVNLSTQWFERLLKEDRVNLEDCEHTEHSL